MPARHSLGLLALILATRFAHVRVLWVEEAYPMSGALTVLHGLVPYRDFWYDKPPLALLFYLLCGAHEGWPLRLLASTFIFACAWAAWWCVRSRWTREQAVAAAWLTTFFLTFGVPAAVMAIAPDLILVLPHLLAIGFAWRGRALAAGVCAGFACWAHVKGLLVLMAAALFLAPAAWPSLLVGWAVPVGGLTLGLISLGALGDFWIQVIDWGRVYARDTFLDTPWGEGWRRTVNWLGFAAAMVVAAGVTLRRESWRRGAWLALSLASVALGLRFFPRYYLVLVPPLAVLAARSLTTGRTRLAWLLLLIPLVRFGPGYVRLANGQATPDLALFEDDRRAAAMVAPGESLFVWGYRPELFVLTRAPLGAPYLESQPLTGVFADRHLTSTRGSGGEVQPHLLKLARSRPRWVVDGLGPLNPALGIDRVAALEVWRRSYREAGRTATLVIYRRVD